MGRLLLKSIGIASGLALLLPPGWCALAAQGRPTAPVAASCCRHESSPSSDCRSPRKPITACCCAQDATVPEKTATPAPDGIAVALAVPPSPVPLGADFCCRASDPAPL